MAGEPDTFRVSPTTGGLPLRDAPLMDNKAPGQAAALGEVLTKSATQVQSIYLDQLQRANQIRADEAANQLKEAELDLTFGENGYLRHKGRDALFRPGGKSLTQEYGDEFDKRSAEIMGGLSNDSQREAFQRVSGGMGTQMRGRVDQHFETQFGVYNASVNEGIIKNQTRAIGLNWADPDATNAAVLSTRGAVYNMANLTGRNSAEEIEADTKAALTPGFLTAISTMLENNDPSAAAKYIDLHRKDMTAEGLFKADAAIGEAQDVQITTAEFNKEFAAQDAVEVANTPQQLMMPVRGGVGSVFGEKRGLKKDGTPRIHKGIDIPTKAGTPVSAPAEGIIRYRDDPNGFGYYVDIDHGGGLVTRIAHMSQRGFEGGAADGSRVAKGQIIGLSGGEKGRPGSGNSQGPHVHYEVLKNGKQVDPTGRHATSGASGVSGAQGGGRKSLSALLQAGRNNPLIANDPQRLAMWDNQARTMYSAQQADRQQQEEDATNAGYNAVIEAGGDMSKVSPSVLAAIPGRAKPGLYSFADNVANPASNQTADLGVYGSVRMGIASGEITEPSQITKYAPLLGPSLTKQLIDDVTSVKKGDQRALDSVSTTKGVMGWVNPELERIGIDEKSNPKEYIKFRGTLLDQIARAERAKGGALTGDEANEIASSLIAESAIKGGGFFGSSPLRGYQVNGKKLMLPYKAIPVSVRVTIEQSLIRRGIKPTEANVRQEYYEATQAIGNQ